MSGFNISDNLFDYEKGFTIDFNLLNGMSSMKKTSKRFLSKVKDVFYDVDAADADIAKNGDKLVYEFHEMDAPDHMGDIAYGMSIVYPGKVGNEYYMTKGHFHSVLDTAEVYYCLEGHGYMMLESPEGDWSCHELLPGKMVYCPRRYAHRSINVSPNEPLRTFFVFRGDAGHDYGTIEEKGYRNLLVEEDGEPKIIANPKWGK